MNENDPRQQLDQIKKLIDDRIKHLVPIYLQQSAFSDRKLTDTPTDELQVVPRKYVNANGTMANRPQSSVATVGQKYFATDLNQFMIFNGTNWYNGVASVVAPG